VGSGLRARLDRLEAARARVLSLLEGRELAALDRPPGPGRWSALQVLHHVVEAEAGTLAYVRKKMQAGPALPRGAVSSRLRAPAVAAAVPDTVDPAALRARWEEVRREWRALVEAFPRALAGRLVFRHPVAGRLTLADTLAVLQAHLDHHVPQVKRALSAALAP
jgi:hypothetical protein